MSYISLKKKLCETSEPLDVYKDTIKIQKSRMKRNAALAFILPCHVSYLQTYCGDWT